MKRPFTFAIAFALFLASGLDILPAKAQEVPAAPPVAAAPQPVGYDAYGQPVYRVLECNVFWHTTMWYNRPYWHPPQPCYPAAYYGQPAPEVGDFALGMLAGALLFHHHRR